MTDKEFTELQNLVSKLQTIAKQASKVDQTFNKYHLSSLGLLDELPNHLSHLRHGLKVVRNNPVNQSESKKR